MTDTNPEGLRLKSTSIDKLVPLPKIKDRNVLARDLEATLFRIRHEHERYEITDSPGPLPWPSYDTTPVERIPGLAVALGVSPSAVAAYELEHENRDSVLDAFDDNTGRIQAVVRA